MAALANSKSFEGFRGVASAEACGACDGPTSDVQAGITALQANQTSGLLRAAGEALTREMATGWLASSANVIVPIVPSI
jgi:hypothetical protein